MNTLLDVINLILNFALMIIIVQIVLSWLIAFNVISMHNDFVRQFSDSLFRLTEPIYRPIRRILPDFGALDLAPMVVILLIYIIQGLIGEYARPLVNGV
ncbi:YggT family protein [Blastomonas sp.]|uniref:YggT family protein n=1 Tax=Blastomonas sp. TaxID=1909299 RepID=UPI003594638C